MREIKFRAWDKEKKKMYADVGIFPFPWNERTQNNSWSFSADGTTVNPYHENIALMQYADRKDKNGKEIYKGDILGAEGRWFKPIVGFENGCFVVANLGPSTSLYDFLEKQYEDFNVIGNIHENPEL